MILLNNYLNNKALYECNPKYKLYTTFLHILKFFLIKYSKVYIKIKRWKTIISKYHNVKRLIKDEIYILEIEIILNLFYRIY